VFRKAVSAFPTLATNPQIQDLGVVVKENVAASFSYAAFPLALKCLEEMRATALTYEETETYNE
jgi:ATP-dependent DNA helicase 2 subunit 2